jgi:hypothetical protein
LEKLRTVKYGRMKKFDMQLLATYIALGVVPILSDSTLLYEFVPYGLQVYGLQVYGLQENVHYVKEENVNVAYETLQQNCLTYYNDHMQPAACLRKLLDFIFIRDI